MTIPEFFFTHIGDDDTYVPSKAHENDTGWDVKACEDYIIKPFETAKIRLGIRCFAPKGWWLELRPRSSTMAKKNLHCLYGVIDEGYEGEIVLAATWIPPHINDIYNYFNQTLDIKAGEKIGQLIPVKRVDAKMTSLSKEEWEKLCAARAGARGSGGFGSTG